jgi:hypothetical protein
VVEENRRRLAEYQDQSHEIVRGFEEVGMNCEQIADVWCRHIPLLVRRGWLRHQEDFGEAHLSAADGVVAQPCYVVSDHAGRCRGLPSSRGGEIHESCGFEHTP